MQTNTNNVNKTRVLLQTTGGKEEPYIVFMGEIVADITTWKMIFVVLKLPIL
jgi:hypothetical protein